MAGQCIFCGAVLQPSRLENKASKTKEHVYGRRFRDALEHHNIHLYRAGGDEPPLEFRRVHVNKFVNASVCGGCNHGWMSRLEQNIDPVIEKLNSVDDVKGLSRDEVETMARWAAKTAVVLSSLMATAVEVPECIRRSLLPNNGPPRFRCFYARLKTELPLQAAFYQTWYGEDLYVIGNATPAAGLRFTLCVFDHLLTIDFPPALEGLRYDLSKSCSARIWPSFLPAGTNVLQWDPAVSVDGVLRSVANSIHAFYDLAALKT
jgi:hypothetical protein